jgi:hypothetical protein
MLCDVGHASYAMPDSGDEEGRGSEECNREERRGEEEGNGELTTKSPGFYTNSKGLYGRIRNSMYLSGNGTFDGWDRNELRWQVRNWVIGDTCRKQFAVSSPLRPSF